MFTQISYTDTFGAAGLGFTCLGIVVPIVRKVLFVESWLSESKKTWELI